MRGTPCAIFDLDGTLSDCAWRQHNLDHTEYARNSAERWAAFFAGIPDDPLIEPVARVLDALYCAGYKIVLATGRSETNRDATLLWLRKHSIPYHALYMRKSDCFRADNIVKGEILDMILADDWQPFIVFDDRQSVVDMWRERGLLCAQVAKGDF